MYDICFLVVVYSVLLYFYVVFKQLYVFFYVVIIILSVIIFNLQKKKQGFRENREYILDDVCDIEREMEFKFLNLCFYLMYFLEGKFIQKCYFDNMVYWDLV